MLLPLFTGALLFSACRHPESVRDHSRFLDPIYDKADSMDPDHKERAFAYLDSVYKALPRAGPGDLYRKYDYFRHYYFETRLDYARTMLYTDSGLAALEPYSDDPAFMKDYGRALFAKGDMLLAQGKYSQAFLDFYRGQQVIEKAKDTCLLGELSGRLALAYYKLGKYPEAIRDFRQSFVYVGRCTTNYSDTFQSFANRQGLLDNIALGFAALRRTDSAEFYYDSALSYIRANEPRFRTSGSQMRYLEIARAVIRGNQGNLFLTKGDSAAAESCFRQSIDINLRKEHATEDAGYTLVQLIHLNLAQRRFDTAFSSLQRLRRLLDTFSFRSVEMQWQEMAANYYDSIRQPARAYTFFKEYVRLRDSLDRRNKPADVKAELQRIEAEYELALLKKSNETKNLYLFISILFCVMTVVIIGQFGLGWSRTKRNLARLTQLNDYIQLQNDHLQKALTSLEQSQEDNTRIISVVAHDLRNPIGGIHSMMTLLLDKKDLAPDTRKMLQLADASSRSSLELINDLLHTHAASEEMTKEPVDMAAMLRYCTELLQFKAQAKQQRILLRTLPVIIEVSREKMWRVLSNLITNALKFSPQGKDISVGMETIRDKLRIWVIDQGIGIPDDMQDTLFDPKAAVKRRGTAGEESFGLGLGISRQIVTAHGGTIWCESTQGVGSSFYVELPLRK